MRARSLPREANQRRRGKVGEGEQELAAAGRGSDGEQVRVRGKVAAGPAGLNAGCWAGRWREAERGRKARWRWAARLGQN